jgi:glycosyltransferase involved in cell wall biosynthesis
MQGPLADALTDRGVEVATFPLGALRRSFRPDYLAAVAWNNLSGAMRLARLIREQDVALVHSNNSHVLAGALAARMTGRPHIAHVRENILPPRAVSLAVARAFFLLSDRAIVVSRGAAAEFLGAHASHRKVRVIYNGVDLPAFDPDAEPGLVRERLGWPREELHVGIVARLTPWKGHQVFLEAAALVAKGRPGVRFVIVGDADTPRNQAYKRELEVRARQLGIAERVRWTGFVSPPQALISALDVVVVPSVRPEPFGRAVVEAMASRRPVVATNRGGPPEILSGGGGLLVRPADAQALADAVLLLLRDDDLRLEMGRVALAEAHRRFDIRSHVKAVTSVYDEVLHHRGDYGGESWIYPL